MDAKLSDLYAELRSETTCRLGLHCRKGKRIPKYDNGRLPLLCCYCYLIVGHWEP